jgi:cation diffusion facilitator CzcD-associated flavoprotein CzcO
MKSCDVAIIGAGPYGLSIAAHLKAAGVQFRIFGEPMGLWASHMPKGMELKSEGFASWLYDPGQTFTLENYCKQHDLPYRPVGYPVPLDVFCEYGLEFQRRFVPELEREMVESVRRDRDRFELTLSDGEVFSARRVVVAVGLTNYAHVPQELSGLPKQLVTHSYEHSTLDHFKGQEIGVLGGGSSAVDLAASLHEAGASAHVIARGSSIRFHDPPKDDPRSLYERIRRPFSGIGPGWKHWLCANLPLVFRLMPESFRLEKVRTLLGPAPGWSTKARVVGKVQFHLSSTLVGAEQDGKKLKVQLKNGSGQLEFLQFDHLISATGYKTDVRRIPFLGEEILSGLRLVESAPALSSNFESSVPNLYFVGVTAANTFGPLLRFAVGAGFAAPRVARHLQRTAPRPSAERASIAATNTSRKESVSR